MSLVLRPSSHDKHSHNMASTEARKGTKRSTRFAEYDQDPKEKRIKRNFMNKALLTETFKSRAAEFYRSGRALKQDSGEIEIIQDPFQCCVIPNFIDDEDYLKELKADLMALDFNEKSNDLYKFQQSDDLKTSQAASIQTMRSILYCDLLSWLQDVTGLSLNETMDMSCAKYSYTDTLLCHDDELEGRRIAFIFYLVPPWEEKDGGTLDLFAVDEDGHPSEIKKVLTPCWNTLIFFEVTPISFHQVSEVLNKDKCRLSVSGWFHGETVPRPLVKPELKKTHQIAKKAEDEILLKWINPMYLNSEIVESIQDQLEENSEIQLDEFLLEEKYDSLVEELRSSQINWKTRGPANKRRYETVEEEENIPVNLKSFMELMHSEPMFKLLTKLTGLNFAELDSNSDDEKAGPSSQTIESGNKSNPTCCSELRHWSHGCYTLIHDNDPSLAEFALDAMFFLDCDGWDSSAGGFTSYIASGEDEELLTVCPTSNCLALVYRDKETVRFVKHINASCKDVVNMDSNTQEPSGFYDISFVYYE